MYVGGVTPVTVERFYAYKVFKTCIEFYAKKYFA